jgi:hypothetical protein
MTTTTNPIVIDAEWRRTGESFSDAIVDLVRRELAARGAPDGALAAQRPSTGPNPWDVPAGEDFAR